MAITISGNIAWLSQETKESIEITDEQIIKLISENIDGEYKNLHNEDCVSIIAQSSGTTSVSKCVMLSQRNVLSDTMGGLSLYDYPLGAIYYKVLPYHHLFGLVADLLGALYSDGTICFSNDKLNLFKNLRIFKPTHMNLPPIIVSTIEKMLSRSSDINEVTGGQLKKIMCAGAALNEQTQKNMKDYGIHIYSAYGLTECSPCVSMNCDMYHKNGSVGVILPGVNVMIDDGEILVRGDIVMKGYWKDIAATNQVFKDGWLMTGDLGYLDEDGFLFLTGRKTNLIVFEDGTKLSPEIMENKIKTLPEIDECLVYSEMTEDVTVLKITVVSQSDKYDKIKVNVKEAVKKYGIVEKLQGIYITDQPLEKNNLGKIIRK